MPKIAVCLAFLMLLPALAPASPAQDAVQPAGGHADAAAPPAHFYRLDYVLEELDPAGKPVNSRSFSMIVSTGGTRSGTLAVGSKVPIMTGSQNPRDNPNAVETQFQYIDVGVKITASDIREEDNHLAFNLHAEVSSLEAPSVLNGVSEPVFRQNVWSGDVLIQVGKSTVAFKSDSLENKGSMQLEVTAAAVE